VALPLALFDNFGFYEIWESKENDCYTDKNQRHRPPGKTIRYQCAINPHDQPPVQNNMQHKQDKENYADYKMNRSPLMPIQPPEKQVDIPTVNLPSTAAGNQYIFDQNADPRNSGKAQQQHRINNQVKFGLFHNHPLFESFAPTKQQNPQF